MCGLMMIQMNVLYALVAISLMVATYFGLRRTRRGERDLTAIFQGTMFQLTRRLQISLQKNRVVKSEGGWRPSIVAEENLVNAPLMLLLAYIIVGHREWRHAEIRLFVCFDSENGKRETNKLSKLMTEGRLPISRQNVTSVSCTTRQALEQEVLLRSSKADLVIAGLTDDDLQSGEAEQVLQSYNGANDVLFVHASEPVAIE